MGRAAGPAGQIQHLKDLVMTQPCVKVQEGQARGVAAEEMLEGDVGGGGGGEGGEEKP